MPHLRHRIRPATPEDVAEAVLDLVTVEHRPVPVREVLRTALRALLAGFAGAVATVTALVLIGWLL